MRLRKRHAWGVVLIALFALPVLEPRGVRSVEDPASGVFTWLAGATPLNPRLWRGDATSDDEESARTKELERANAELWETIFKVVDRARDAQSLQDALELDRLPVGRHARVLRAHDSSAWRRSILVDQGG